VHRWSVRIIWALWQASAGRSGWRPIWMGWPVPATKPIQRDQIADTGLFDLRALSTGPIGVPRFPADGPLLVRVMQAVTSIRVVPQRVARWMAS
jgi:hypothetical protein